MRTSNAWCGGTNARGMGIADLASMLWAERALVLGLGGVICALGLVAALAAPKAYAGRAELMIVTLLIATVVAIGAGLSRAANAPIKHAKAPRPAKRGRPRLVLIEGGA
jgi:uncharacterized protein involved in exopolysaccharide biosynthesis